MWCRSYRGHVIMAFPSFDTATHLWAPQASISWVVGAVRESAFVRFSMRVTSESEAVECALRAAKTWIDDHKRGNRRQWDASTEPQTPIREASRTLLKGSASQTRQLRPALSRNSGKTLTFEDFKTNLASLGANLSEPSLLKSYAALVQLRTESHCSWGKIRSKLKRSQEHLQPASRRSKPANLPLTLRDWRRII